MKGWSRLPGRAAKHPFLFPAVAIVALATWATCVAASNLSNMSTPKDPFGGVTSLSSGPSFAQAATVQGISTTQDPAVNDTANQLNTNTAGSNTPVNINPPSPPTSEPPITIEPDPMPIPPQPPCKYIPENHHSSCYTICKPCSENPEIVCPIYNNSSRNLCHPCLYPQNSLIACPDYDPQAGRL